MGEKTNKFKKRNKIEISKNISTNLRCLNQVS